MTFLSFFVHFPFDSFINLRAFRNMPHFISVSYFRRLLASFPFGITRLNLVVTSYHVRRMDLFLMYYMHLEKKTQTNEESCSQTKHLSPKNKLYNGGGYTNKFCEII